MSSGSLLTYDQFLRKEAQVDILIDTRVILVAHDGRLYLRKTPGSASWQLFGPFLLPGTEVVTQSQVEAWLEKIGLDPRRLCALPPAHSRRYQSIARITVLFELRDIVLSEVQGLKLFDASDAENNQEVMELHRLILGWWSRIDRNKMTMPTFELELH